MGQSLGKTYKEMVCREQKTKRTRILNPTKLMANVSVFLCYFLNQDQVIPKPRVNPWHTGEFSDKCSGSGVFSCASIFTNLHSSKATMAVIVPRMIDT